MPKNDANPYGFDLLQLTKRLKNAEADEKPNRADVVFKLLRRLPEMRGDFTDREIQLAGELLVAGAKQQDDNDKSDVDIWDELDEEDATEAKRKTAHSDDRVETRI